MAMGGVFLALVGATGSYRYALDSRLALWLGLCAVAGIIAIVVETALVGAGLRSRNPIIWWGALALALGVAMIPVIFLVNATGQSSPIGNIGEFARNSIAISAALTALRLAIGRLLAPGPVTEPAPKPAPAPTSTREPIAAPRPAREAMPQSPVASATPPEARAPAILERLPLALQAAEVKALNSEGHYVQVYTSLGRHMLLMRLGDAIALTSGIDGLQVHRSWWVSRDAVIDTRTASGKLELQIEPETWVPVSRSYRAAWRAES